MKATMTSTRKRRAILAGLRVCVAITATLTVSIVLSYTGIVEPPHRHYKPPVGFAIYIIDEDGHVIADTMTVLPGDDTLSTGDSHESADPWIRLPGTRIGVFPRPKEDKNEN